MIEPKIIEQKEKKLLGISAKTSLVDDKTAQIWGEFGPRIKEIQNRVSTDKISMQIYPSNYFLEFKPKEEFEKWATAEVSSFSKIPNGMKSFTLEKGLYAVFNYKGSSANNSIFQFIFSEWLPKSKYQLDHRPHFEVLGDKYKNNDPNSEEEIWIPIKPE